MAQDLTCDSQVAPCELSPEALEMSQQHNEQIEGMDQLLDFLADVIRQPLSDAARARADDLLREIVSRAGRFRDGLESITLDSETASRASLNGLLRINQLMGRVLMLQQRHREWVNASGARVSSSPEAPAEAG